MAATSCERSVQGKAAILPEYDSQTGRLKVLHYDSNGNGRMDTWSHMDGSRVMRVDIDGDEDGRIERWEHYAPGNTLIKIEISTRRNGRVDRTEFYEQNVMVRAEEDTDTDGKIDKWETYENGRLASVALDTLRRGTPDRRVSYSPDGSAKLEHIGQLK